MVLVCVKLQEYGLEVHLPASVCCYWSFSTMYQVKLHSKIFDSWVFAPLAEGLKHAWHFCYMTWFHLFCLTTLICKANGLSTNFPMFFSEWAINFKPLYNMVVIAFSCFAIWSFTWILHFGCNLRVLCSFPYLGNPGIAHYSANNVTCPLLNLQINHTHLTMLNHYSALVSY